MAKNILNGYAVKAFSEHPTALWPLDDDVFYVSLIPKTQRQFSNWPTKNNTSAMETDDPLFVYPETLSPFDDETYSLLEGNNIPSPVYISNAVGNGTQITYTTSTPHGLTSGKVISIIGTVPAQYSRYDTIVNSTPTTTSFTVLASDTGTYVSGGEVRYNVSLEAISEVLFNANDLNILKSSFCVNQYIHQDCVYVNYYEVGYSYVDSSSITHEVVSKINSGQNSSWINFQNTHAIPDIAATNFKLIFRVNVTTGGTDSDYRFYMNGLSVGQWSEVQSSRSLGVYPSILPPSCGIVGNGVPSDQYGILTNFAYYVEEGGELLSKNVSSPIVFGTDTLTDVSPSPTEGPSFIFPGMGLFNESGRYKNQTLEMWIRIKPNTIEPRRIAGPVSGDYGIYVRDNNIVLVVGDQIASHYISQWYRPMLVHLTVNSDSVNLLINGEGVISIDIDRSSLPLPNSYDDVNYGADWWGVYSYPDIEKFEIDCISIYPYVVSDQIAKKRFVWGQGTPSVVSINNQYFGTSIVSDYSTSNYSTNVVYPDAFTWNKGYSNNLLAEKRSLSTPDYSLPEVFLGGRDVNEWYLANNVVNQSEYPDPNYPRFVTFRPNQGTRTNFCPNPSFEVSATTNYTVTPGVTRSLDTTNPSSGTNSLLMTLTTSGTKVLQTWYSGTTVRYPVTAGVPVTISFDLTPLVAVRSTTSQWTWWKVPTGGTALGVATTVAFSTTQTVGVKKRMFMTQTPPEGATHLSLNMARFTTTAIGDAWRIDNVLIEDASTALPYFDGSYADPEAKAIATSWNGTPNASISTMSYWTHSGNDWDETSYLYFDSLNVLSDPVSAIYGVFETPFDLTEERPLIFFKNSVNGKTFSITIKRSDIYYKFGDRSIYINSIMLDEHFSVGINFQDLATYFGNDILDFFSYPSYIQMYVGGDGSKTFEGKMYRVGFSNQYNYDEISDFFYNNGIAIAEAEESLTEHFATYTLMPMYKFNRFFLDISISSQWEEYFPLSFFSRKVADAEGTFYYDLDMMQINLDYSPVIDIIDGNIDTSKASLKTYFTFQSLIGGANDPISNYPTTEPLSENKVIDAKKFLGFNAYNRKFEFIDNTIVIPPKTVNMENIAMTVFFDLKHEGIISSPVVIRNFEIASNSFDDNEFKRIGTRYGVDIYPYSRDDLYYSSKNIGAFSIYKKNTPYLYLTDNSGFYMIPESDNKREYGFSIPINQNSVNVEIGAMQLWMKREANASSTPKKIFDINGKTQTIEFMIVSDISGKRGVIYARDSFTKNVLTNVKFYQNGIYVNNPIVQKGDWNCIGISFDDTVDMKLVPGSINLFGGTMFDNMSYYLANGLGRNENTLVRPWIRVLEDPAIYDSYTGPDKGSYFDEVTERMKWNYWYTDIENTDNDPLTIHRKWSRVYLINQDPSYLVTPENIYAGFTGTVVNIVDDDRGIELKNDALTSVSGVSWSTSIETPA